jgi:methylmalonyl-CoA mutase
LTSLLIGIVKTQQNVRGDISVSDENSQYPGFNFKNSCTFEEFEKPDYLKWKEAATSFLKGAPFKKKLITASYEKIEIEPIYVELPDHNPLFYDLSPGIAPYARGVNSKCDKEKLWDIVSFCSAMDPLNFNNIAKESIKGGASALVFVADSSLFIRKGNKESSVFNGTAAGDGLFFSTSYNLKEAFGGINLTRTGLFADAGSAVLPVAALFVAFFKQNGIDLSLIKGCLGSGLLGQLARSGKLPGDIDSLMDEAATFSVWANDNAPLLKTIWLRSDLYHHAGASADLELAFGIAEAIFYIRALVNRGMSVDDAANQIVMHMASGSNFLMEIAKLRAARMLFAKVVSAFGGGEKSQKLSVFSSVAEVFETDDFSMDILRATTRTLGAAVGGASFICSDFSYDGYNCIKHIKKSDDDSGPFLRRLAGNIQHLLQHEAGAGFVIDPMGGAYAIESMTAELAEKAWNTVRQIEDAGGMSEALKKGVADELIEPVRQLRIKNINRRRDVFVGINMYTPLNENKMSDSLSSKKGFLSNSSSALRNFDTQIVDSGGGSSDLSEEHFETGIVGKKLISQNWNDAFERAVDMAYEGKTLHEIYSSMLRVKKESLLTCKPLVAFDAGAEFKKLRELSSAYKEKYGVSLKICIAAYEKDVKIEPRIEFVKNFFEVAHIESSSVYRGSNLDAAINFAVDSGCTVAVFCAQDKYYGSVGVSFAQGFKKAVKGSTLVIAGRADDCKDELLKAGVDEFIYIGVDVLKMLRQFMHKMEAL